MRLSGWALPTEHLSATSIAMAVQCPEKYRRRYLAREKEKLNTPRFLGTVDHKTHEANFAQKVTTGTDLSWDELKGVFTQTWDETLEREGEPTWDDDPEKLKKRAMAMAEVYHAIASPTVQPVGVEEWFELQVPELPVKVVGCADVRTVTKLVERKTAKAKLSKPKPAWRFQARIYQLAADLPTEFHVVTKQATPQVVTADVSPDLFLPKGNADVTVRAIQQVAVRLNDYYARYGPDTPWPADGTFGDWTCDYCTWGPKMLGTCAAWT